MSRTHDVIIIASDIDRLESELAAVTEERDITQKALFSAVEDYEKAAEQRDKLEEALRDIAEGSSCSECGGGNAVWLAEQALATMKGGQP
jgi:hypothetical protein